MGNLVGLVQDGCDTPFIDVEPGSPPALEGVKLTSFDMPGRGEPLRLALLLANAAHCDDERIAIDDWTKLKASTPWLTLPILTLPDGAQLGQPQAILRWIGAHSGLYPRDHLLAAHVDELLDGLDDVLTCIKSTGAGLNEGAQAAARAAALAPGGGAANLCAKIDQFIAAHGEDGHAVGSSLTLADIQLFWFASLMMSGCLDGVPREALSGYPHIQAVRKTVGTLPKVRDRYISHASEGVQVPHFELPFLEAAAL